MVGLFCHYLESNREMSLENIHQIKKIALFGATGKLGKFLLSNLIEKGYVVRVLARDHSDMPENIEIFRGDLSSISTLEKMVEGVDCVINASGEVRDIKKMWETNVQGVKNLTQVINKSDVKLFCQISSAGVVGMHGGGWIDETVYCDPQNSYEKSKLEGEKIIVSELRRGRYCILRPTNIVFPDFNPQVSLVLSSNFLDKIKCYIKAKESCHLVHVHDVVNAIIHFIKYPISGNLKPVFFLSIDHDKNNFFNKVYERYFKKPIRCADLGNFLLIVINYLKYGASLNGRRFSSEKILKIGFKYEYSVELILKEFDSNK